MLYPPIIPRRFAPVAALAFMMAVLMVTSTGASGTQATSKAGPSEWAAVAVGRNGRSVELAYLRGCFEANAHVTVRETPTSVVIAVVRETLELPPGVGAPSCPAPSFDPIAVALARPLAGRRIYGRSASVLHDDLGVFGATTTQGELVRVPRLIGFAPQDAEYSLAFGYLRERVLIAHGRARSGLPRVIEQTPAPGQMMRRYGVVRLLVAR